MKALTLRRKLRRCGATLIAGLSLTTGLAACVPPGTSPTPPLPLTPVLSPFPTPTASPVGAPSLTPLPSPTASPAPATPDPEWSVYTHPTLGFSLRHPPELAAPAPNYKEDFGFIGEQIFFQVMKVNPLDCRGDCPVVEMTTTVQIAGLSAIKINGYVGAVGGNVPQHYLTYLFQRDIRYYALTLYALPHSAIGGAGEVAPLKPEDIQLFEQVVATFQFTP